MDILDRRDSMSHVFVGNGLGQCIRKVDQEVTGDQTGRVDTLTRLDLTPDDRKS